MLKAEQVPDEAVVALATSMGWQSSVSDLRGVDQMKKHVAAALNAWPGMDYQPGAMVTKTWRDPGKIILPLPKENSNA